MKIEARNDSAQWTTDFCELPARVRQGSAAVGLVAPQLWGQFLKMAPPQASQFWVVYDGETAVGRIGATLAAQYPGTGVIGFFETDGRATEPAAVATMLLSTA